MAANPQLRQAAEKSLADKNRAFGPTVGQFHPKPAPPTGYQKDNGIYGNTGQGATTPGQYEHFQRRNV